MFSRLFYANRYSVLCSIELDIMKLDLIILMRKLRDGHPLANVPAAGTSCKRSVTPQRRKINIGSFQRVTVISSDRGGVCLMEVKFLIGNASLN